MAKKTTHVDEPGDDDVRAAIIKDVLHYLVDHPWAKDTAEGVRWWCRGKGSANYPVALLEGSLDILVQRGWLIKREMPRGRSVYGLHPDCRPAVPEHHGVPDQLNARRESRVRRAKMRKES
ncbi:hypothetical protein [Candidatus Nitrospira bockiana]